MKSLVKKMTLQEAKTYCENNPKYKLPNCNEAEMFDVDLTEHNVFWISDMLGDRAVVYDKNRQAYYRTHPEFLHWVVLKKEIK